MGKESFMHMIGGTWRALQREMRDIPLRPGCRHLRESVSSSIPCAEMSYSRVAAASRRGWSPPPAAPSWSSLVVIVVILFVAVLYILCLIVFIIGHLQSAEPVVLGKA